MRPERSRPAAERSAASSAPSAAEEPFHGGVEARWVSREVCRGRNEGWKEQRVVAAARGAVAARGVSACSPTQPTKRAYEVVVRTTSTSLMRAGVVDSLQRLRAQLRLHARLTLLVDATICAGLACNATWLAADLRLPVFTYTARDLAARWPRVQWPVMHVDKPSAFWASPSAGEGERWARSRLRSGLGTRRRSGL